MGTNMRRKIIPYNPRLVDYARDLRKRMTLAEVLLWKELKGKRILGSDFDRQKPIGEYIVDFFCKDLMLAIEVDGTSHDFKKAKDEKRQRTLESLGVKFLRFWDCDVKNNRAEVVRTISAWILNNSDPPRPAATPPWGGD